MAESEGSKPAQPVVGNATAPFIYFDAAVTFGTNNGVIEIELASRSIVPANGTRNEVIMTAHLRCSPNAAASLREAIDKALAMLANSAQPQAQPGTKLN